MCDWMHNWLDKMLAFMIMAFSLVFNMLHFRTKKQHTRLCSLNHCNALGYYSSVHMNASFKYKHIYWRWRGWKMYTGRSHSAVWRTRRKRTCRWRSCDLAHFFSFFHQIRSIICNYYYRVRVVCECVSLFLLDLRVYCSSLK